MCGISAIVKRDGKKASKDLLLAMMGAIQHRGPDSSAWSQMDHARVLLGHNRLSIVDLEGGSQPLFNEDGSLCLIMNGEIYDHLEITRELEARGHSFRTRSDSEVVLHLYEEHGLGLFERLNGEFAFVLWDQRKKRLLAACDRFGIKPLHYHESECQLLISSEIKGLFSDPNVSREISPAFLNGALLGSMRSGMTPFSGIKGLPPGHYLLHEGGSNRIKLEAYWKPRFKVDSRMSLDDASEEVSRLMTRAVQRRLVADVPVATYLSGGIDSSIVCGLMAKTLGGGKLRAFNIGFRDPVFDESSLAARIASHFDVQFESFRCSPESLAENLESTLWHIEAPITNPNSIVKQILSGHVHRQGIKVCQTGEGSDELFGGYAYFKLEALWREWLGMGQGALDKSPAALWKEFQSTEHRSEGILWRKGKSWRNPKNWESGYPSFYELNLRDSERVRKLTLSQEALSRSEGTTPLSLFREEFAEILGKSASEPHPFNSTRLHSLSLMSNYIIPKLGDRVEMAHSLECRTPFLDVDLANFAFTIPPEHFLDLSKLQEKRILKLAFKDLLPSFLQTEHKHPFMAMNWRSLRKTAVGRELFETHLSPRAVREAGLLNPKFVSLAMALWRALPESHALAKRLDSVLGTFMSLQATHSLFVSQAQRRTSRPLSISETRERYFPPPRSEATWSLEP